MDGIFTESPTLPINEMIDKVKTLNKPIHIHLMVKDLIKYINDVIPLKSDVVIIHLENENFMEAINLLHQNNIKVGLALNPETSVEDIYPYLNKIDLVLLMSVKPGKGGQKFIDITDKLNKLISYKDKLNFIIEIDGGINDKTINEVKKADVVVVGSYITDSDDYKSAIYKLKKALRNGFTLAELLGVIVVLSILGLVAVTTIDNSIKKSRYDSCIVQEKNLTEGAKMMMIDNPNMLPTVDNKREITVKELQDGGYIEDNLENPMTEDAYVDSESGVSVIITTENGSSYKYTVNYNDADEKCSK